MDYAFQAALKVEIMHARKPTSAIPFVPSARSAMRAPMRMGNGKACYQHGPTSHFQNGCPIRKGVFYLYRY